MNISFHTMHRGKFSCATCLRAMKGFACLLALIVIICFPTAYCQLLANGWAYVGDNLYSLFPVIYKPCKIEQKCNIAKVINGKNSVLAFTHTALKSLLFSCRQRLTLVPLSPPARWLALIPASPEHLVRFSPFASRWRRMGNWLLRQLSLSIPQPARLCRGER